MPYHFLDWWAGLSASNFIMWKKKIKKLKTVFFGLSPGRRGLRVAGPGLDCQVSECVRLKAVGKRGILNRQRHCTLSNGVAPSSYSLNISVIIPACPLSHVVVCPPAGGLYTPAAGSSLSSILEPAGGDIQAVTHRRQAPEPGPSVTLDWRVVK